MNTTANLSGKELPQRLPSKILRRFKRKKYMKRLKKKLLWERNGNYGIYDDPNFIGKDWDKFFGMLKLARKKNYFAAWKQDNYGSGRLGKYPGFFHKNK